MKITQMKFISRYSSRKFTLTKLPHKSGLNKLLLQKYLKEIKLHLSKHKFVHTLELGNQTRHFKFFNGQVQTMLKKENSTDFFSESIFRTHGHSSLQNSYHWYFEHTYCVINTKSYRYQKLNV